MSHARQGVPRIWAVARLSPVDLIDVELKTVELNVIVVVLKQILDYLRGH